jgi:hypothetical protein
MSGGTAASTIPAKELPGNESYRRPVPDPVPRTATPWRSTVEPSLPDTSLWHPVLRMAVEALTPSIVNALTQQTPTPWRIVLPDSVQPWPAIEEHFLRVLRARPVLDEDFAFGHLRINVMSASDDSVQIAVGVGRYWRCARPDQEAGHQTTRYGTIRRIMDRGQPRWSLEPDSIWTLGHSRCL